ncbi:hypothetical protein L596_025132 [Steinernema carpocapsae]|uniref:Uncharacterized protein n=1 Tax=Steinernema carpocapsae TaxID=34508 RepID=A0A4V5ZYY2_STECR|nr:hypothetical protein L596_025132 [Steinernema carpocapsae]
MPEEELINNVPEKRWDHVKMVKVKDSTMKWMLSEPKEMDVLMRIIHCENLMIECGFHNLRSLSGMLTCNKLFLTDPVKIDRGHQYLHIPSNFSPK